MAIAIKTNTLKAQTTHFQQHKKFSFLLFLLNLNKNYICQKLHLKHQPIMTQKLHLLFIFLIGIHYSKAQCPPRDIELTSQTAINNFIAQYPNCTTINGDLKIEGASITYLNGLSNITTITGDVKIKKTGLVSLNGLQNLIYIGKKLSIKENNFLVNLNGIYNLSYIGEELEIEENPLLNSISALGNLTHIGNGDEAITIKDNSKLTSLNGLGNANTVINGSIKIKDNNLLSVCTVSSLCNFFNAPSGSISISNNQNGCNSYNQVLMSCSTLSEDDFNIKQNYQILQNPMQTQLEIINNSKLLTTISLYDISGREVLNHIIHPDYNIIKTEHLSKGTYILKFHAEEESASYKIIIQ